MSNFAKLRFILLPLQLFYAFVIWLRNVLYDKNILKSYTPKIPSICVGNIAVGGTGKTPMVEYLIDLLKDNYHIIVISRGYKRKTKGLVVANSNSTAQEIGDEAMQYWSKFQEIDVIVDADRTRAVKYVETNNYPSLRQPVIIFDDAFQHRKIKAGLNMVLTDYAKPYYKDCLLPVGNLRDEKKSAKRTDIVIVTKSPKNISVREKKSIIEKLNPKNEKNIYFSHIEEQKIKTFEGRNVNFNTKPLEQVHLFLLTGIHNNHHLIEHLLSFKFQISSFEFPDHHDYTKSDMKMLQSAVDKVKLPNKYLITTEKDFMRLKNSPYLEFLKNVTLCYLPMKTAFSESDKILINNKIQEYVRKT
ncbi:MAG: tetraacyldisaccharide 4'-kinase [Bacteroidales bacterium]|jgi:tetraacyldisaccharide 4'-kinase|nr:tetraacyldisaccharide 4'-kinase [Bacteroidales bacterium]